MNKNLSLIFSIMLVFSTLAVLPLVIADGASVDGGVSVGVDGSNNIPIVCQDSTQRSWYPNDQTIKTAEIYGDNLTNIYGDDFYEVDARGDYVFAGELLMYYVYVGDENGKDNIEDVTLTKDGVAIGNCNLIDDSVDPATDLDAFSCNPNDLDNLDSDDGNIYSCIIAAQNGWSGNAELSVMATDEEGNVGWLSSSDLVKFNPDLSVTLTGNVDFGTVEEGDEVTSNTVYLNNVGTDGVVMDMYIGSDDYFTDSSGGTALCVNENGGAATNGIHYTQFSYYATKGSLDSGDNDNNFPGLGDTSTNCEAATDEYTGLTSYSGDIEDDCRIINHVEQGSFLTQGQSMSITFQLDVPSVCEGSFTDGQFHFTGRVV